MLTNTLAMLSTVIGIIHAVEGHGMVDVPFRGMNVILVSNFHQFLPVENSHGVLYCEQGERTGSAIGDAIYQQFKTVVILKKQLQITDAELDDILLRLRIDINRKFKQQNIISHLSPACT